MLKVNGEVVNFKNKEDEIVKRIESSLAELKKLSHGDIILEYSDIHCDRKNTENGNVEYAVSIMLPYTETITTKDGESEIWTYYERIDSKIVDDKKVEKHIPKRYVLTEQERFTGNYDKGKLFFLVFISPRCEFIKGLKDLQNQAPSQKSFRVVLPEFDNKMSVEYLRKKSNVENRILNDLDETKLRTVAKAMGCLGIDTMGVATATKQLLSVATVSEEKMNEFMEMCSDTPVADIKSVVSEAIEERVILTMKVSRWTKWAYIDPLTSKGDANNVICTVSAGQEEREAIDQHMIQTPKDFEVLEKKLKTYKLKKV